MSGPKISIYELTGWAKSVVYGQIRCEQESIACAEQVSALIRECLTYHTVIDGVIRRLELLEKRTGNGAENITEVKNVFSAAEQELSQIADDLIAHQPHISEKYTISNEAYEEKKQQLAYLKNLKISVSSILNKLDAIANEKQDGVKGTTAAIKDSIAEDLSGVSSFYIPIEDEEVGFKENKRAVTNDLIALAKQELPGGIIHSIQNALSALDRINDDAHLSTFTAVTVKKIFSDVDAYEKGQKQAVVAFEELLSRYKVLCEMADIEPLSFTLADVATVKAEIDRLEQAVYKQQAQEYISDCVDEVMSEMGYDLIGSREVKKRNGKRFKNELYSFNEGTAVNITYAADGQISMELGGLSRQDRVPTAEETAVLTEDMETFCGEFAEFERRLRAKGVVVGNRIALSPPTADYAAIINLNDYNIEEHIQVSEIAVSDKKRKTAEKKHMRRDD